MAAALPIGEQLGDGGGSQISLETKISICSRGEDRANVRGADKLRDICPDATKIPE